MFRRPAVFVAGICCGAAVASRWRPLAKRAIVAGVVGGEMVKTGAARMAENLSDVTAEALSEMQVSGSNSHVNGSGEHVNGSGGGAGTPSIDGGNASNTRTAVTPSS
jgi:Protein of unknown function (DUF5132)